MGQKVSLGGNRLGSGAKNDINLHGYERSNHDLSYLWKSTMAPGTLVPFMVQVALPGDTFDIDLDTIVKTHPTIGPLFGSFKVQLDIFSAPIRIYHRTLHNNKLGVGMNMSNIKLPQMFLSGNPINFGTETPPEFQQINQSSLLAYLGVRGLARSKYNFPTDPVKMLKNALPLITYWDIFKNYYANKQEENAYVIEGSYPALSSWTYGSVNIVGATLTSGITPIVIQGNDLKIDLLTMQLNGVVYKASQVLERITEPFKGAYIMGYARAQFIGGVVQAASFNAENALMDTKPKLKSFPLENLDGIRDTILAQDPSAFYLIQKEIPTQVPLNVCMEDLFTGQTDARMKALAPQCGLAIKTFQSDLFNNWLNTEWIEGSNSIAEITAISTSSGSFSIDTLNLSKKVYDMLNRIATSGGSYEDWLSAVYDHNSKWRAETPIYHGGLSKEVVFQEVISQSATTDEPLGSMAGKGVMSSKHKGGKVVINIDEPSYIMGIVSITPRIDYCQGNEWDTNLQTLDDLHKPALDGIGFQDLVTEQMAFWSGQQADDAYRPILYSAGKVPAWVNYMTNYNKCYGNFADPRQQMFMTLARRYEPYSYQIEDSNAIKDITTYIDPSKFNYAFADTTLSAQNFWVQIACNINARRKISAKIIPNL